LEDLLKLLHFIYSHKFFNFLTSDMPTQWSCRWW